SYTIDLTDPDFTGTLYTSEEYKVDLNGTSVGTPVGATDSSPSAQAARGVINGTSANDVIDHNTAFS
ncbi:MAG: hypothetical protein GWN87_25465, partial [Desulfuromonadales bacterium]|nr:hypothetical protein [Desulfuromonadales bacterium]NIS43146.1 hypothetical protein [Desulfuromonadales bacterium]